jgi:hypothetical protein
LRLSQVPHAQTRSLEDSRREIRPPLALRSVFEIKNDLATLPVIESGQEFVRRGDSIAIALDCIDQPFWQSQSETSQSEGLEETAAV